MSPGKPVLTGSSVEIVTWGVSNVAKGMTQALLQVFGNSDRIGSMGFASPNCGLSGGRSQDGSFGLLADAERLAARAYVSPVSLAQMHFAFGKMNATARSRIGEAVKGCNLRETALNGILGGAK